MNEQEIFEIVSHFQLHKPMTHYEEILSGHINSTYRICCGDNRDYILQKINRYVFKKPEQVMENICAVTAFLRKKIILAGGDPERETLTCIPTHQNLSYHIDSTGEYWRMYIYIHHASAHDAVTNPVHLYNAGVGFGRFQTMLADFPIETLHDTIPNFHNTPKRFDDLFAGISEDPINRVKDCQPEIRILEKFRPLAAFLTEKNAQGILPTRVTHNDTKYNNIMLDDKTDKALCVIDLDTVMPGLSAYDFGDAIRFAASTAAEDEKNLDLVHFDLKLYELFTGGFVSAVTGFLPDKEVELLPYGALLMTLEVGSRFLLDYITGDKYFRITHPTHNLERTRTQLKLALEMEERFGEMNDILKKYTR